MPQKKIELSKPRDFGEIINDSFLFVRQNFKYLIKYFFIFCGVFLLASIVVSVITQLKIINTVTNYNPNSFDNDDLVSRFSFLSLRFLLLLVFLFLEYCAINVTITCYMALYKHKGKVPPTTEEMWGYFKFFFLKVLGSNFILSILTLLGFALCILPGFYLGVIFALVPSIMIVENTSFGYAFNQCFRLIKDNWWVTFGAMVVMGIIIYVMSFVMNVPALVLRMSSLLTHSMSGTTMFTITTIVSSVLEEIARIFQILAIVTTSLCYFNLSESKDGTSLMERINRFGTGQTDLNAAPEEY